ncbi:hypothetical protein HWV62_31619 [Athelia sp. TMB]|nr:hypothetical protein HWV62_31619 [Athelia sp. TMB]
MGIPSLGSLSGMTDIERTPRIVVCDLPEKFDALKESYVGVSGITVLRDGHLVSRTSDFIMYSVEAEFIDSVVAQYGPSTKYNAVVAGQTSVKAPEKAAFEKYLPEDVHIVSCHSLHGPTVSPLGQPLVLIKHRAPDWALTLVENILRSFRSRYVYLSYEDHDIVTANTQAVTHAAFLSMGTAWASSLSYPWEHGYYVGGIETVKVNIMLRIYANLWHVYAGLAILNPHARTQIDQYAKSTTELIQPLHHLDLAATPIFRMWIGVAEYLFRSPARLDTAIHAALYDTSHRSDDLEFVVAARGWSQCVSFGSFELYRRRFEETKEFFKPRFEEATKLGGAMIQAIMEDAKKAEAAA